MKGLLLDLDDTLVDEGSARRQGVAALFRVHGPRYPALGEGQLEALWRGISRRHWQRYVAGEISFQEQRRGRMRELLGEPLSAKAADAAFEPYRLAYEAAWRPLPDLHAFLDRTRDLPKVIITNGDRCQQRRKLEAAGLAPHVLGVLTPDDCGCWKPDPGIFLAGLARLGLPGRECAMIGDDETLDLEPARRLGLGVFRVDARDPERTLLKALEALSP
ncbi:HAD family hydrolase [uncultured Tolumonas sp.]|uniref:HAD family hydrolase n=1 Tax=uncultured Tolumonas sp. TaxID=263765 RepID=UPI00292F6F08|nr:HAD family hydrolase [uncultured Tolumonas sp.]